MSKHYCDVCCLYLNSITDMKTHLQGIKHLKRKTVKDYQENQVKKGIFITNLPIRADENLIRQQFIKYGEISKVIHNRVKNFAIVQFSTEFAAKSALSNQNWMFGQRLLVKKQIVKNKLRQINFTEINRQINHSDLLEKLKNCESVWEQMVELQSEISLNEDSIKLRKTIANKLQNVLEKFFLGSRVQLFGSSVNGFGFHGCDVDLQLKLPDSYFVDDIQQNDFVPSIDDVVLQKINVESLTLTSKVRFIQKLIKKYIVKNERVLFIPSSRCPLVKFPFNICNNVLNCDLTVGRGMTIENSVLLYTYGQLEPNRIKPLIFTLRYWGKFHQLIGSGEKLSSYAFAMLTIFYLQIQKPPIVPTVLQLKELVDNENIIGNWDCSFCKDVNRIPKSENKQSVKELLQGFFNFYAQFDFILNVICPRTGKVVCKKEFMFNPVGNFKIMPISIQDPFDLSHNIGSNTNEKFLDIFKAKLQTCVQIINSKTVANENWTLTDLLVPFQNPESQDLQNNFTNQNASFKIKFTNEMLKNVVKNSSSVSKDVKSLWLETICSTVINIFKIALCGECKVIKNVFERNIQTFSRKRHFDDSFLSDDNPHPHLQKYQKTNTDTSIKDCSNTSFTVFCSHSDGNTAFKFNIPNCSSVDATKNSFMQVISSPEIKEANMEFNNNVNTTELSNKEEENDVILHLSCIVRDQIWKDRRKETKDHCSTKTDILEIEQEISQNIISTLGKEIDYLKFDCIVKKHQIGGIDAIFTEFFSQKLETLNKVQSFIKPFVSKLIVKCMEKR